MRIHLRIRGRQGISLISLIEAKVNKKADSELISESAFLYWLTKVNPRLYRGYKNSL